MNKTPINSPPSFIKLAMRNMVSKGKKSVQHFGLTALILISLILLLAFFGKPNIPGY
tara:strand:- start:1146 stop:1316 length:171 start_codon:yes stop_codon:yes gene_type:complete